MNYADEKKTEPTDFQTDENEDIFDEALDRTKPNHGCTACCSAQCV
jgi:hypothetical protein